MGGTGALLQCLITILCVYNCQSLNEHYKFNNFTILDYQTVKSEFENQQSNPADILDVEEGIKQNTKGAEVSFTLALTNNGKTIAKLDTTGVGVSTPLKTTTIDGYFWELSPTNIKGSGLEYYFLVLNEQEQHPGTQCLSWFDPEREAAQGPLLRYYGCTDRATADNATLGYVFHPDSNHLTNSSQLIKITSLTYDMSKDFIYMKIKSSLHIRVIDVTNKSVRQVVLSMRGGDQVTVIEYGADDYVYLNTGEHTLSRISAAYFRTNISTADARFSVLLNNRNYNLLATVADGIFTQAILPKIIDIRYFKNGILFLMGNYYFSEERTASTIKIIDTKHRIVSTVCFDMKELRQIGNFRYPLHRCRKPWFSTHPSLEAKFPKEKKTLGLVKNVRRLYIPATFTRTNFTRKFEVVPLSLEVMMYYEVDDWDKTTIPTIKARVTTIQKTTTTTTAPATTLRTTKTVIEHAVETVTEDNTASATATMIVIFVTVATLFTIMLLLAVLVFQTKVITGYYASVYESPREEGEGSILEHTLAQPKSFQAIPSRSKHSQKSSKDSVQANKKSSISGISGKKLDGSTPEPPLLAPANLVLQPKSHLTIPSRSKNSQKSSKDSVRADEKPSNNSIGSKGLEPKTNKSQNSVKPNAKESKNSITSTKSKRSTRSKSPQ